MSCLLCLLALPVLLRYGPLARVEIKRNYAFVEYKEVDDAIEAQKKSHGAVMSGRTITVEFVESSCEKGGRCVGCAVGLFLALQHCKTSAAEHLAHLAAVLRCCPPVCSSILVAAELTCG
jgi:ferredoxin